MFHLQTEKLQYLKCSVFGFRYPLNFIINVPVYPTILNSAIAPDLKIAVTMCTLIDDWA